MNEAAKAIRDADCLLITAGAGMGVDSGLPDFRGNEGFWQAYPPFAKLGLGFQQLANPAWFDRDPGLAWGFYGHRLELYRRTVPHSGFARLLGWARQKRRGAQVFTSNVDGQFQRAGFSGDDVFEAHGSIHHLQCQQGCTAIWSADGVTVQVDPETMRAAPPFPRCPGCGGVARPNILMFCDVGFDGRRYVQMEARFTAWMQQRLDAKLVIVELGAGTAVPTVRNRCEQLVRRQGATLIRINPGEPEVPPGQFGLPVGAKAGLEALQAALDAG